MKCLNPKKLDEFMITILLHIHSCFAEFQLWRCTTKFITNVEKYIKGKATARCLITFAKTHSKEKHFWSVYLFGVNLKHSRNKNSIKTSENLRQLSKSNSKDNIKISCLLLIEKNWYLDNLKENILLASIWNEIIINIFLPKKFIFYRILETSLVLPQFIFNFQIIKIANISE